MLIIWLAIEYQPKISFPCQSEFFFRRMKRVPETHAPTEFFLRKLSSMNEPFLSMMVGVANGNEKNMHLINKISFKKIEIQKFRFTFSKASSYILVPSFYIFFV